MLCCSKHHLTIHLIIIIIIMIIVAIMIIIINKFVTRSWPWTRMGLSSWSQSTSTLAAPLMPAAHTGTTFSSRSCFFFLLQFCQNFLPNFCDKNILSFFASSSHRKYFSADNTRRTEDFICTRKNEFSQIFVYKFYPSQEL